MGAERKLGDYTLMRELGRGGMGVVWAARHPRFGDVALKVVLEAGLGDPEGLARLRREATALTRLSHPNVVGVHEVGEHGAQPFVAMAFVDGESLHDRLRRGPLEAEDAARVAQGIAEALVYVHAQGVLHRDLKPHNVLLRRSDGEPVLVDFGLARLSLERQRLTTTGQVVGTPAYMAPEQALGGQRPTPAIDVYGLGATLYEMLCGAPPFSGANPIAVMAHVLERAPRPPSQVNPKVDRELEQLCLSCLEKDPAGRPEAADLAGALERWRDAHERASRRGRRRGRSSSRASVLVGAVAVALVALAGAFVASRPTTTTTTTDVAPVATTVVVPRVTGPERVVDPPPPPPKPDDPLGLLRRAVPLVTQGRACAVEALELAGRAARLSPQVPRVLFASSWVTRGAARAGVEASPAALLEEAQRLLERAEREAGPTEPITLLRAAIDTDRKDLDRLRGWLETGGIDGRLEAAKLCRKLGRREQAIELFELVRLEIGPARPDVDLLCNYNAAGELSLMLRTDEALERYRAVLGNAMTGLHPASGMRYSLWCYMRMAEVFVGADRFVESLEAADAALRVPRLVETEAVVTPADVGKVEAIRAIALAHLGRWSEALRAAELGLEEHARSGEHPMVAAVEAVRGVALARLDRAEEGRRGVAAALVRAHELPLESYGAKLTVSRLARVAFPEDPEIDALVEAAFP